jgi:cbb3-type cytochrome oxidase subunit 1
MGVRLLKIAAVYLLVGVSMGLYMGITHRFTLHPVHAHINLLGWASLALAGLIYVQFPEAAKTRLAQIHFWMHNMSLPVLMVALAFLLSGNEAFAPVVGIMSIVTALGLAIFVINICVNVPSTRRPVAIDRMSPAGVPAK